MHPRNAKQGLILLSIAVGLLLLAGSWIIQLHITRSTQKEVSTYLYNALDNTHKALNSWFNEHREEARIWANTPDVIELSKKLLKLTPTHRVLVNSTVQEEILALLLPAYSGRDHQDFFIIGPDGITLSAGSDRSIGYTNQIAKYPEFWQRVWSGEAAMSLPWPSDVPLPDATGKLHSGLPTMYVGAPIADEKGDVIAVLAFRVDPRLNFSNILRRAWLGGTGDTYAFNSEGLLLSDSRFGSVAVSQGLIPEHTSVPLNLHLCHTSIDNNDTKGLCRVFSDLHDVAKKSTLSNIHVNMEGYENYLGQEVVGAWVWNPAMNMGMATEIHTNEVYKTLYSNRWTMTFASVLSVILLFGLVKLFINNQRKILDSDVRHRTVLNTVVDGILLVNTDGKIESYNPAAEKIFGYTKDEALGNGVDMLMPYAFRAVHKQYMQRYMYQPEKDTGLIDIRREMNGMHKSGRAFPMDIVVSKMSLGGRLVFNCVVRDITEQKRSEGILKRRDAILQAVAFSAEQFIKSGAWDAHMKKILEQICTSAQASRAYIYRNHQAPDGEVFTSIEYEWSLPGVNSIGGNAAIDHVFVDKLYVNKQIKLFPREQTCYGNTREFPEHIREHLEKSNTKSVLRVPVFCGDKWWGVIGLDDCEGEREWLQAEIDGLKTLSEIFGASIARRQVEKALVEAREQAEEATKAKSDFLAVMSHEIRTPMNGVLGMAHLLKDNGLTVEQQEKVETIIQSGHTLLTLINDILDFSKIEAKKLDLELLPFDLEDAISDVTQLLFDSADKKGLNLYINIDVSCPKSVIGDSVRIRQILLNLVSNAIKFTQQGHVAVKVTCETMPENIVNVCIEVEDSGIGIPKESQSKLFHSFSQVDASTTRQFGGTGLGLAICKRLVEMMQGTIGVESTLGEGSTFWVNLPLPVNVHSSEQSKNFLNQQDSESIKRPSAKAENNIKSAKILLVEDNEVNQKVAKAFLSRLGANVSVASNGYEALAQFEKNDYDLIFMDCLMPEMDGFETTAAIRKTERGKKLPIIAVTANVAEDDKEKCRLAGMDDFLPKPFELGVLTEILNRWLSAKTEGGRMQTTGGV